MNHFNYLIPKDFSNTPALGVVFSRNTGFGQGVEEGGLADVGQAHDSAFERHGILSGQNVNFCLNFLKANDSDCSDQCLSNGTTLIAS
jgi:cold shock CspA family protein